MKESDLYIPVRDWLRSCGYTVHVEVFGTDVVGINDAGHLVAVELKTGMTRGLYEQLSLRTMWADEVWAAVPPNVDRPRSGWDYYGYGLLIVKDGRVKVRRKARPQPWHRVRTQAYRRKVLRGLKPAPDHHLAVLPCCPQAKRQRAEVRAKLLTPDNPAGATR